MISVIIPVYNRNILLQRALDSLIQQDFHDWEAIVVDDGSCDFSPFVADHYAMKDPRIRSFSVKHEGPSLAKNFGATLANGSWITFLDSDDYYQPYHLSSRIHIMQQHPDVTFIHGGLKVLGDPTVADRYDQTKQVPITDCVVGGTFFIKTTAFDCCGGFKDLDYAEDAELFDRLAESQEVLSCDLASYMYDRTVLSSRTGQFE